MISLILTLSAPAAGRSGQSPVGGGGGGGSTLPPDGRGPSCRSLRSHPPTSDTTKPRKQAVLRRLFAIHHLTRLVVIEPGTQCPHATWSDGESGMKTG